MGKNSGKRRVVKLKKDALKQKAKQKEQARFSGNDAVVILGLRQWLARRHPLDVLMALLASELWLPNIGAQVKHGFVYSVFMIMPEDEFDGSQRIHSHEDLRSFLKGVFIRVPSFPVLEDYVPELDWGFVKTPCGDDLVRMFYSGYLERIPDQVEAYRIKYEGCDEPLYDMEVVLRAQDYLLNHLGQVHPDTVAHAAPGYREIPPEIFWERAKTVFAGFAEAIPYWTPRAELICLLGTGATVSSLRGFSEMLMEGQLMPAPFVRIGARVMPLFPRNTAGWVIDHWGEREGYVNRPTDAVAHGVAAFLRARFRSLQLSAGPYQIVRRDGVALPFSVAGYFVDDHILTLIVVANDDQLEQLPQWYVVIERAVASEVEWGFRRADGEILSIQLRDGRAISSLKLTVLVVVPKVTTASIRLRIRPSPAKLIYLSDFVAIFDAVRDVEELQQFWRFQERESQVLGAPMFGATDMFGAFRQLHGTILPGAREYSMVMLDPHTGSGWRFEELKRFWESAPPNFPDHSPRSWTLEEDRSVIWKMGDKRHFVAASSALIATSCLHVVVAFPKGMPALEARVLNLVAQCLADALATREALVQGLAIFANPRIVTYLSPAPDGPAAQAVPGTGLLSGWQVKRNAPQLIELHAELDVMGALDAFKEATDAKVEVATGIEWLLGASHELGLSVDMSVLSALRLTDTRPARFTMSMEERAIDVPDGQRPDYPEPVHFKRARQQLARALAREHVVPGRYELAEAKAIIAPVLTAFRDDVHRCLLSYGRDDLLTYAVQQFDALLADNNHRMRRIQLSQAHEVDYDRSRHIMDMHTEFIRRTNTYRYLIEAILSVHAASALPSSDRPVLTRTSALELLAVIDWLLVLYDANTALHYGIQPGGIEIDQDWVPQVFYASSINEEAMQEEQAVEVLGQGLNREDEPDPLSESERLALDTAFVKDAGFSLTTLMTVLRLLRQWQRLNEREELQLSYAASTDEILKTAIDVFYDLDQNQFKDALSFLTIDPDGIRRLTGVTAPAADVPFWEHRKRAQRISIRPIIARTDGVLMWGAACVDRAYRIWSGTFGDGYPPADFSWPNVEGVAEQVKKRIEREIEDRAYAVMTRFTPYVAKNVDLRRRFPAEGFEEIGDYDVLAYLPSSKIWVCVEAKYNKPPFTVKDSRRLRDDIFGPKGHVFKSSRRVAYLETHATRIAALLKWPTSRDGDDRVMDIYVCPRIMYWMRNPPAVVKTEFVRLSALETWFIERGFASGAP